MQRELERASLEAKRAAVVLCDRGTLDGLAYWPLEATSYFRELAIEPEVELTRYAAIIHLRTPTVETGYDHTNPLRIEDAGQAKEIDQRIEKAWANHPRRAFVQSEADFLKKVARAVALIRREVPECCRAHRVPEVDG